MTILCKDWGMASSIKKRASIYDVTLEKFRLNLWEENLPFWIQMFWSDKIVQNDESIELILKVKKYFGIVDKHDRALNKIWNVCLKFNYKPYVEKLKNKSYFVLRIEEQVSK